MGFLRRILDFTRYGQARRLSQARATAWQAWCEAQAQRRACLNAAQTAQQRGDTRALHEARKAARIATHAELSRLLALRADV